MSAEREPIFDARRPETLQGIAYDFHVLRRALEPTGQHGVDLLERLGRIEARVKELERSTHTEETK